MTADFRPLSGTKTAPEAGAPSIEAGGYGPVWLLAVGQTVGYCGLYYIYAALLPDWEATLGWSKATLAVGPTLAILLSALLAPVIGRLVDGGHGGTVLVAGPLIGAAALLALAFVTTPLQFALGWAVIGLAQAMSFYEACFSYLTRVFGAGARPAITRVTLVAGFASTITFPAAAMLVHLTDWRGAVIGFALALALVAAPANLLGSRCLRDQGAGRLRESGMGLKPAMVRREFWTTIIAYNAIRMAAACSAQLSGDVAPREISFVSTCQYVLAAWDVICSEQFDNAQMQQYCLQVMHQISKCRVGNRPGRFEPRVRKKRGSNYNLMKQPRNTLRGRLATGDNSFETK